MTQACFPVDGATWPTKRLEKFGARRSYEKHQGADVEAPEGTPVRAMAAGRVVLAVEHYTPGWRGYGRCIAIEHGGSRWSFYAHLSRTDVVRGAHVDAGEQIGLVGTTKWTTAALEHFASAGAHCHVEVMTRFPPRGRGPAGDPRHFTIVDRTDPVAWLEAQGIVGPFVPTPATPATRTPSGPTICPTCHGRGTVGG